MHSTSNGRNRFGLYVYSGNPTHTHAQKHAHAKNSKYTRRRTSRVRVLCGRLYPTTNGVIIVCYALFRRPPSASVWVGWGWGNDDGGVGVAVRRRLVVCGQLDDRSLDRPSPVPAAGGRVAEYFDADDADHRRDEEAAGGGRR